MSGGALKEKDAAKIKSMEHKMKLIDKINTYVNGDDTLRNSLITELSPIAEQLINYYVCRYPRRSDDIRGQAMLGLVQAVDWLPTKLQESANPMGYVFQTIRRFITTGTVRIPGLVFDSLIQVPLHVLQKGGGYIDVASLDVENDSEGANILDTLTCPPNHTTLDINLDSQSQTIVDLLTKGYTYREIAVTVNKSKSWVSNKIQKIKHSYERAIECG